MSILALFSCLPGSVAEMKLDHRRSAQTDQIAILWLLVQIHRAVVKRSAVAASQLDQPELIAAPFNLSVVARHIRVIFKSDRVVEGATYGHEPVFNFQLARCVTRLNDNEFCERHDSFVRSA